MDVTQFSIQNKKKQQEDRSFILHTENDGTVVGVFDGHGGSPVADYAAINAPIFFQYIRKNSNSDTTATLIKLFRELHEDTYQYTCGSTATIVWIKDNFAHVAVLGDSEVLIKTAEDKIWKSPRAQCQNKFK